MLGYPAEVKNNSRQIVKESKWYPIQAYLPPLFITTLWYCQENIWIIFQVPSIRLKDSHQLKKDVFHVIYGAFGFPSLFDKVPLCGIL